MLTIQKQQHPSHFIRLGTCTFFELIKCISTLVFCLKQLKWSHNAGVVPETIATHSYKVRTYFALFCTNILLFSINWQDFLVFFFCRCISFLIPQFEYFLFHFWSHNEVELYLITSDILHWNERAFILKKNICETESSFKNQAKNNKKHKKCKKYPKKLNSFQSFSFC